MKRLAIAALLTVGAFCNTAAQATTYDATADYQTVNNPSGVWSYGYSPLGGTDYAMTLFDAHVGADNAWVKAGYINDGTPSVWKNLTGPARNGVGLGQLSLHPGPVSWGDYAILRFTAPTEGTYAVTGQFFAGDWGSMSGSIVLDGNLLAPLQYFAATTDGSVFAPLSLPLLGGKTLDFVVGNNGSYSWGNTPLSVTIDGVAAVPEPESYAMMLVGLGLLGFMARRRKQEETAAA